MLGVNITEETYHTVFDLKDVVFPKEEKCIDLILLAHARKCPEPTHDKCHIARGKMLLYGDWILELNGKYRPDPQGRYSAICNTTNGTLIVMQSSTTIKAHKFPNYSFLLGSMPGNALGYALPKEFYAESWLELHGDRLILPLELEIGEPNVVH